MARDPAPVYPPSPRYRLPFDPVVHLSPVRATYALLKGLEQDPDDLATLSQLVEAYGRRGMHEAAVNAIDRIMELSARLPMVPRAIEELEPRRAFHRRELGEAPETTWRNVAELDRVVTGLLATGRAAAAADILERANPPERASWDVLDRMATLRLHLGEPARRGALESWPGPGTRPGGRGGADRRDVPGRVGLRIRPPRLSARPGCEAGPLRGVLQPRRPGAGCRRRDGRLRAGEAGRRRRPERSFSTGRRHDRRRGQAVRGQPGRRRNGRGGLHPAPITGAHGPSEIDLTFAVPHAGAAYGQYGRARLRPSWHPEEARTEPRPPEIGPSFRSSSALIRAKPSGH